MSFVIPENMCYFSNNGIAFGPIQSDENGNIEYQENTYRIIQVTKQDGNW